MSELGKMLILGGALLIVVGALAVVLGKIPGMGKLPGDILIKKENFTFYFPLASSILLSLILSLIFYLWNRR